MKTNFIKLILVCIFILPQAVLGQSTSPIQKIDSIQNVIAEASHDSVKINAWFYWAGLVKKSDQTRFGHLLQKIEDLSDQNLIKETTFKEQVFYKTAKSKVLNLRGDQGRRRGDYEDALKFYTKSLEINKDLGIPKQIASSYNNIGIVHGIQANYDECKKYILKSLEIYEQENDVQGMANAFNNLGNIHYYQGDYKSAIEYWISSLKAKEEAGEKIGMANTLNNIGNIYLDLKDYENSISYYQRSMKIYKELEDDNGIGVCHFNLGNIYQEMGETEKAIQSFNSSLEIHTNNENKRGIADAINGLGTIYNDQGKIDKAKECFEKALALQEEIGGQKGVASAMNNLAIIYMQKGDYLTAAQLSEKSLGIGQKIKSLQRILDASETLWKVYRKLGKPMQALEMHELYTASKDSLMSEENRMEIVRQEIEYEYQKQSTADSIRSAEEARVKDAELHAEQAENRQKDLEMYFLFGVLALALIFGGFIYNRFRITNQQKDIIEEQKSQVDVAFQELEEKNKEILDSINYAKRIQYAILPPKGRVQKLIPNSFIFYKPKDIVAGDFYWLEQREGKILVAACDCTGHGVPGAMVSVVCNNGLNRAVREHGLTNPGKILDKTREIVIEEFEKSEEDSSLVQLQEDSIKDGMDVALIALEQKAESEITLCYSGANNPLWVIRKGADEVEEYKATKQPIGKFDNSVSYDSHEVDLKEGDTIYLFTDGFSDQFGGPKSSQGGKKYKTPYFKKFLLSIQNTTMLEQGKLLEKEFESWKGDLEQLDDVCVIGIRI